MKLRAHFFFFLAPHRKGSFVKTAPGRLQFHFLPVFYSVNLSGKRGEQKQQKNKKNTVSFKGSAQCVKKWCIPYYKSKRVCFTMVLPHNNILSNVVLSPSFLFLSPHLLSPFLLIIENRCGGERERRRRKRTVCPRGKRRRGEEKHFLLVCAYMCTRLCAGNEGQVGCGFDRANTLKNRKGPSRQTVMWFTFFPPERLRNAFFPRKCCVASQALSIESRHAKFPRRK